LAGTHGLVNGLHGGDPGAKHAGLVDPVDAGAGGGRRRGPEEIIGAVGCALAGGGAGGIEQQRAEHSAAVGVGSSQQSAVEALRGAYGDALSLCEVALTDEYPREVAQRGGFIQLGAGSEPGGVQCAVRGVCGKVDEPEPPESPAASR
jgi:hypothetical protein